MLKEKILNHIKRTGHFIWEHKVEFAYICLIAAPCILNADFSVCDASAYKDMASVSGVSGSDMPWSNAVSRLYQEITGPIPKVISVASLATGGLTWMMGQGQMSQIAMRGAFGTGIVTGAPSLMQGLFGFGGGSGASGCLFF